MKAAILSLIVIFPVLLLARLVSAQANVNENLETAFIYVDATQGSDSNPGTKQLPLKTIGAAASMAVTNNHGGIGTRVTINPGTYRESITLNHSSKDTNLPITFEAATNGTVIISGGVVYAAWVKYGPNPSIYTNTWTNQWGQCSQLTTCPYQQNIVLRREMVFVNGTALTQVMSFGEMQQGTFYVDESGAQIYVWPPSGTNMSTATVEVATLPTLFSIQEKSNVVLRGLTFQYANTCHRDAAVQILGKSNNILLDSDVFQWNNSQGLSISNPTASFTVENSSALHNGDSGFHAAQTKSGLWQTDITSYNNWRGAQGAYYGCNTAGAHFWGAHNDTISGLTTSFNEGYGIHWDTDNANISGSGVNATSNLLAGLFIEKNEGPITLSSSYVCSQNSSLTVGGLVLRNSEGVSLSGSVLMNNLPSQIDVIGKAGGIQVSNWETGKSYNLVTQNFSNTSNTIQGTGNSQQVFVDSYLDGSDWNSFESTLNSSSNTWWNSSNSKAFTVPTPKKGTVDDFSNWQSTTGQDSNSKFVAPSGTPGSACNLSPQSTDYWLTIDNPSLTVKPGNSAKYNLTLTPFNFTGTVNLTLDGIAEVKGLSSSLSAASIKTSGTSALTLTAGSTTPAGTYAITVIGNSGSLTRTVTVSLVVQ